MSAISDPAVDLRPGRPLRVAALVKQIPKFEDMTLDPDGRLVRDGLELHMNDYCRRGVRVAADLAAVSHGTCTAVTLGPPEAHTVLREAVLCGATGGLHVTDPAFAGSDTLATARALAAALTAHGPFDVVLCGRNSVDADTGQVPGQVAELLGWPLLTGVRELTVDGDLVTALLEHDDEWVRTEVALPVVLSCAERLCDPCKIKDPEAWATVEAGLLTTVTAAELGAGPWGQAGSPTRVGEVRELTVDRAGEQATAVARVLDVVAERGALDGRGPAATGQVAEPGDPDRCVIVLVEHDRPDVAAELLGSAAALGGTVTAVAASPDGLAPLGADRVLLTATADPAELAAALHAHLAADPPWAMLAPGTAWGRHVAARLAARLGAGLTGDAVDLRLVDGRLVADKPAFGGRLVAAIHCSSPTQMATVRPGVLPRPGPRSDRPLPTDRLASSPASGVRVLERWRDDDAALLATASIVIGVGQGVAPDDLPVLEDLAATLGAELCATRKVTDAGWMPRARQVGITGHAIAPALHIAVGTSGKFNHTVGLRNAGTVVAVNPDPDCELWSWADVGLVAEWQDVLADLVAGLTRMRGAGSDAGGP